MNTDSTLEKEVEEFLKSHNLQESLKYLKDTIPSSINNESKGFYMKNYLILVYLQE